MTASPERSQVAPNPDDPIKPFNPVLPTHTPIQASAPSEQWQPMLESTCSFDPDTFLKVMHNLIKNPNIMSSHLFRADIFYDSLNDTSIIQQPEPVTFSSYTQHLKKEYRPRYEPLSGIEWQRTYVRQLVPRNRQLDRDLVQTCHFYVDRSVAGRISNLVIYVPHVESAEEMPWYHPRVRKVLLLHEWCSAADGKGQGCGKVSVHYCMFPDVALDKRLERTALQLLTKIHKHGRGQQAGYVKRVHHDQLVPQQRFQDTYARLKAKYAKDLITNWIEDTDPGKHVFEDLGIAAFLIELWADMYRGQTFPGFVDIGCGNGLLVYLLIQEGYKGWGFDARRRKTWRTFVDEVQSQIKEMVLVPSVLGQVESAPETKGNGHIDTDTLNDRVFSNGIFEQGTFIISNHADELTPWTPLLAYLNTSPFIAIPCCSHSLSGAKYRFSASRRDEETSTSNDTNPNEDTRHASHAAETGSLKRAVHSKTMPSAYASLCTYVSDLASELQFVPEKEMLRIPSTRNACIVGRRRLDGNCILEPAEQRARVLEILERKLKMPVDVICRGWVAQARRIAGKKAGGH